MHPRPPATRRSPGARPLHAIAAAGLAARGKSLTTVYRGRVLEHGAQPISQRRGQGLDNEKHSQNREVSTARRGTRPTHSRRFGFCHGLLALALLACGQPEVELTTVPGPTDPLRAEALRGTVPDSARIADYVLDASLDGETHQISGTARVRWHNTTDHSVDTLPFHLYMNGFRAEDTDWMRTSQGRHRQSRQSEDGAWGYIDVHSVTRLAHTAAESTAAESTVAESTAAEPEPAVTPTVEPDPIEGNPSESAGVPLEFAEHAEPSLMTVQLPEPVAPEESIEVELDFTTQLPKVVARTGYADDFHAVAQWYPKLAVLEADGQWEAHTFTVNDEFYASFGHYTVHLDVPADTVVGATGVRTAEDISGDRQHLTYEAAMVHDFAWFADPDFVEQSVEHRGIHIRQLIQPDRVADADAHMDVTIGSIDSYEQRFGPYPWSTLTIVHAPEGGEGAGGMEYPTLFTTSDLAPWSDWVRRNLIDERASGRQTTIHEFGHQYFQGLMASREHQQPWLDEGVNSFSNLLAVHDHYEDPWMLWLLGNKIYMEHGLRIAVRFQGQLDPIDQPARDFDRLVGSYGSVYSSTSAVLLTLRRIVGGEPFDRAILAYSDKYRFAHPTGADFENALIAEIGARVNVAPDGQDPVHFDLAEYFDQALRSTRDVDFTVRRIRHSRLMGDAGWQRDASGELVGGEYPEEATQSADDLPDESVVGSVVVQRKGSFVIPIELRVELSDGTTETVTWDAQEASAVFSWPGRRIESASLDPDEKLVLEWRRLDNTRVDGPRTGDADLGGRLGQLAEGVTLALLGGLAP